MTVLRMVASIAVAVTVSGIAVTVGPVASAAVAASPRAAGSVAALPGSAATAVAASPAVASALVAGSYIAVSPARVLDTRVGRGAPKKAVGPRATLPVRLSGVAGVPSTGVSAVVVNLTATAPTAGGYVTAYPSGQSRPITSNLNFAKGESRSHLNVLVPGTGGRIELYNGSSGRTQFVADVSGYYTAGTPSAGGAFGKVAPARVLDTRTGAGVPVPAGGSVQIPLAGKYGIPASGVGAVVLNVTVANTDRTGTVSLTAQSYGGSRSPVLYYDGRTDSNLIVATLKPNGSVGLSNDSGSTANMIVDVAGYFVAGSPTAPGRLGTVPASTIEDDRDAPRGIPPGETLSFAATGRNGAPSAGVSAVVLNVTVVPGTVPGYVSVYASGTARPATSNVNFPDDEHTSNLVVARVGANGQVAVYNGSRNDITVVIDLVGYVGAIPGPLAWSGPHAVDPPTGGLTGISCPTATFCMAIDDTGHVVRYNGSTWSAPQAIALASSLRSVSCPSATFCLATADDGYATFDGTRWSPVRPSPQLEPVSCASASFCAAIFGSAVVTYNGSRWSAPHPLATDDALQSVSCPTTKFCVVGSAFDAWTYRSGTWSAATELRPDADDDTNLYISCSSATFCAAVVDDGQAATFNGSTWSAVASMGIETATFGSLSCVSATFCMVAEDGGGAARFNGTAWVVSSTATGGDHDVSCASASFCASVFTNDAGDVSRFTAGSWHAAISVDPRTDPAHSVSCTSPSFCVMLESSGLVFVSHGAGWSAPTDIDGSGSALDANAAVSCVSPTFCVAAINGQAIAYNGTTWGSPKPLGLSSTSVSCVSLSFCLAVGNAATAVYNGTSWHAAASIGASASVSCASTTFCVAVGASPGRAAVFDGTTWGSPVVVTPSDDALVSVSCVSATFCAAVSHAGRAYTFNGSTWTNSSGDQPGRTFLSVSCASATLCVGISFTNLGLYGDAQVWNGSAWTVAVALDADRVLDAVSCAPTPFCAAVDQSGVAITAT